MRTFFTLTIVLLAGVWLAVWAYVDEHDELQEYRQQWARQHTIDNLKREIRMGPKPYAMKVPYESRTKEQRDSFMVYLSHMTHGELSEVKNNITENVALKGFIDTLIMFKDSLEHANGIYSDE